LVVSEFQESRHIGMKFLLIIEHGCDDDSNHSHKLAQARKAVLEAAKNEVKIFDLIKEGFSAGLTKNDFVDYDNSKPFDVFAYQSAGKISDQIKNAQSLLASSDYIVVFGPMWYFRLPSCFYAFVDKVFSLGFAYDYAKKTEELPLFQKPILTVITAAGTIEDYSVNGECGGLEAILYHQNYVFHSCQMQVLQSVEVLAAGKEGEDFRKKIDGMNKVLLNIQN
jgi:NAD(P)H dehydrogenase (quinone)